LSQTCEGDVVIFGREEMAGGISFYGERVVGGLTSVHGLLIEARGY
jgi:hypothetical protein